ncbi:hypothetical protein DXG01_003294 [Tephrocybe rancida]|nr:hypothetical protein DXG01_003294 [Tephrocybe rancida]
MSDVTQDEIISTIKRLDGIIRETFKEGYPYQRLRGFYPIHLKKTASWPSVVCSKDEKVIEARISSPAFQMARLLQEYSQQACDHSENDENAWHTVIRSTADKKYIPYAPEAALFPPIVTVPVAVDPAAGTIPIPVAETVADIGNPSVPVAAATPSPVVPGPTPTPVAGSNTTPVASSNPIPVATRTPVADSTPAPVAGPGKPSAPIPPSSAKVRTAMITPAGHPGHGPSATKKKATGMIPAEIPKVAGAEKVQWFPADKGKGQAGKQKPNPEEDGWYIDSVHAVPCPNCGKGKKGEEATSDTPRKVKAKPKRKAPKSPEYVSDDDKSPAQPAPPQKPARVIFPADPIRVVTEEDVAAAWRRAQGARPWAAPLPMPVTKQKPVPSRPQSPTPGPSNNPLLAAALKAHVTLPSHTPPPAPRCEKEVDWYKEMVQYVDNVNAGNVEYQQRISSAVGHLSAIVDALPNGASALVEIQDLTSRVSDFEDSTDISFKRLKEHISKHRERCDHTSARITDLEERLQKLERWELEERSRTMCLPTPVAGPSRQGHTFVSPSPSVSSVEHSDDDEEQGEVQAGVKSDGHKEVQASEEDAEGRGVSSEPDTAMGDFSDDAPSPSSQDELEGEVPAEIGAHMEVEHEVENTTSRESTNVPAMEAPATQSGHPGASLSGTTGTDESPSPPNEADQTSYPLPADTDIEKSTMAPPVIAAATGVKKSATAPPISLGGGPIIPGVAGANPPTTMGDGEPVPAIQLTNPTPENLQEQLTPPGPPVQRMSPRLNSDGSGRELRPWTPAPLATGVKCKADEDNSGGCASKPPSKRQHK